MSDGQKLKILKYDIPLKNQFTLELHEGYQVLDVQPQRGIFRMWVLSDPAMDTELVQFFVVGTGQELPTLHGDTFAEHVKTLQDGSEKATVHMFRVYSVTGNVTAFAEPQKPLDRSKMQ